MFKIKKPVPCSVIHLPVKSGIKLSPGHIVKVVEYNNNLVVDICDGYNIFGLVGNRCIGNDNLNINNMAKVYCPRMVLDISKFDRKNKLEEGIFLYCNKKGILTSLKPFENAITLAKIIAPVNEDKQYIKILWF